MKANNLLAEWNYTSKEWNNFVAIEKANKKEDNIYFGIGIVIIGTFALMLFRGTSLWTGMLFSIPLAVLIPYLRITFSYKHLKKNVQFPYVKFYPTEIIVNGAAIELVSATKRIKKITIIEAKNGLNLIEIIVEWLTRKGPTNDEFRFLIPTSEIENIDKLIEPLNS